MAAGSRHQRVFRPALLALVALAWFMLWAWASSPYARYLEHGNRGDDGPLAQLCAVVPAGTLLVWAAHYSLA